MREFRGRKQTATDDDWQAGLWNMVKRDDDGESEAAA
jgi:hypothetical protein